MKLLFLTNVPSPYRVEFFNELGKYCDLTVVFEKSTSDERDVSWSTYKFDNFRGIILKGKTIRTDSAICFGVIKYVIDRSFDHIICSNFSSITGVIAVLIMKACRIPYYLEADGGFAKSGTGVKEYIKRCVISDARGYFSTGVSCDQYFLAYGASRNKLFRYPFTSLWNADILDMPPSQAEKNDIKRKLGIDEKIVFLSVGQFIHRKGYDLLIRAAKNIERNIGIYIVGGEVTQEYLKLKKEIGDENVHFVGFKTKQELSDYYKAADLFVFPTREDIWGLVVNEAMAYGLPILTTNHCAAGLELVDEKNGVLVPSDSIQGLIDGIDTILRKKSEWSAMAKKSLERIQKYTFENMAISHVEILRKNG